MSQPRGLHGQTVELLARRILSNEYPEGTVLDLPTIRAELDLSLTALREALKVLTAKGMIDARQKRGTFVRPRSSWHLLDVDVMRWHTASAPDPALFGELTEVRAVVEPAAARMAAERATDEDVAALTAAVDAMAAATDTPTATAAGVAFHRHLLLATHNDFLTRIAQLIAIGLADHDTPAPVPRHRAVLAAIRAADPEAAETAMRTLITQPTP